MIRWGVGWERGRGEKFPSFCSADCAISILENLTVNTQPKWVGENTFMTTVANIGTTRTATTLHSPNIINTETLSNTLRVTEELYCIHEAVGVNVLPGGGGGGIWVGVGVGVGMVLP